MACILSGAEVYLNGSFKRIDVSVEGGIIGDISPAISPTCGDVVFDLKNFVILPGLADVHVHLREPGFFYKESVRTGTLAAARGGFSSICSMPNTDPVPDCTDNLKKQSELTDNDAAVHVYPYGAVTKGERGECLSEMAELAPFVVAFSDDGRGVQNDGVMEAAMVRAKSLGKIIAAHCEDEALSNGGCVHDGRYGRSRGLKGIPSESEWRHISRDLKLAEKTGCAYHVCHVSAKESVDLIRAAKKKGIDVSCEVTPHHLIFCEDDLKDDGRYKMNPPLRGAVDREALIEGLSDGTIDMIATDHAPHSAEEKSKGLENSAFGVVGLETAFPVLYTKLVMTGIIGLERLVLLMSVRPSERFGVAGPIEKGMRADLAAFDLKEKYRVDPADFLSKGRSTPFEDMCVYGDCVLTMVSGKTAWASGRLDACRTGGRI